LLRTSGKPIVISVNSLGDDQYEVRENVYSTQHDAILYQIESQIAITNGSQRISALISDLDRWLPFVPEYDGNFGADGTVWMIDGVNNGNYFFVHRWNPKAGWVYEIGLRFLRAADKLN
jgi:hypothetical protein